MKILSLKIQFRIPEDKDWLDAFSSIIDIDIPVMFKEAERVPNGNIYSTVRDILS